MNEQIELPNGVIVGTGLQAPLRQGFTTFPEYDEVGPMLTMDEIKTAAATGAFRGRDKFDKSFIKNQRSHGSCNGFAGAAALTKARVRRLLDRVDLSGAYLYSLINGGRDNGSQLLDGMETLATRGIASESTVGWDAIYPTRYDKGKADAEAAQYRAFECYAVRTEQALFSALVNNFDCVVAVHANNGFMKLDSNGVAGGGDGPGNHAVSADGVELIGEELSADGVNSWDVSYGDDGRMGLTWKRHFRPTTKYHVLYAVRSTIDGSKGKKPPVAAI
jgi:hypothetical protein